MKNKKKVIIASAIFFGAILLMSGCTTTTSKIGVISMNDVLSRSSRAGELQQKLIEIGENLESNLADDTVGEERENDEKTYEEFAHKKRELEDKLNLEINKVLDEITSEKNIDIILYKNKTYYGGLDITNEVIKKLDAKYSSEKVGADDE